MLQLDFGPLIGIGGPSLELVTPSLEIGDPSLELVTPSLEIDSRIGSGNEPLIGIGAPLIGIEGGSMGFLGTA